MYSLFHNEFYAHVRPIHSFDIKKTPLMIRQNAKKKYNRDKHVMPNVMKTPSNHPDYPRPALTTSS